MTDVVEVEVKPPAKLRLGGMALRNGLLLHGPTHWSAAARGSDGEIHVASGRKPRVRIFDKVPGLRGVVRMAESMIVIPIVRISLPQSRLPFETPKVAAAGIVTGGITTFMRRVKRRDSASLELGMTALSLAPSLIALRAGELAAYHGAEHKVVGAYEQDLDDAADATKEHERCGSHLVVPMLGFNVLGAILLGKFVKKPTPTQSGAVQLVSTGAAVELFVWAERNEDSFFSRLLKRPGFLLQREFGTREPSRDQLAVAEAAMAELLAVEAT